MNERAKHGASDHVSTMDGCLVVLVLLTLTALAMTPLCSIHMSGPVKAPKRVIAMMKTDKVKPPNVVN